MFEFEKIDTLRDKQPVVVVIPTRNTAFEVSSDFWDEPTQDLPLCWKCGPRTFADGNDQVREPRLAIFCECNDRPKGPPPIPAAALVWGPFDDLIDLEEVS